MYMFRVKDKGNELAKVGYDGNILNVLTQSGEMYAFYKVPPHIYGNMLGAKSIGAFFNENIRGNFNETKIS